MPSCLKYRTERLEHRATPAPPWPQRRATLLAQDAGSHQWPSRRPAAPCAGAGTRFRSRRWTAADDAASGHAARQGVWRRVLAALRLHRGARSQHPMHQHAPDSAPFPSTMGSRTHWARCGLLMHELESGGERRGGPSSRSDGSSGRDAPTHWTPHWHVHDLCLVLEVRDELHQSPNAAARQTHDAPPESETESHTCLAPHAPKRIEEARPHHPPPGTC